MIEHEHAASRIAASITPKCPNMARHAILLEDVRDFTQVWTCRIVLQLAEAESWVCMTAWNIGLHGGFGEKECAFHSLLSLLFAGYPLLPGNERLRRCCCAAVRMP
jgi:hypothetical protein